MDSVSNSHKFILCAFISLFVLLNIFTLKDGHNWGGDFSQYILHAKNILDHKPYNSGIMIDNPIVYPPGFPILLLPFLKFFGVNFLAFKWLNILSWFGAIALLYVTSCRRYSQENVVFVLTLLSASAFFFTFKQNILADVPFFFLVVLAGYTLFKYEEKFSRGWFIAHLACIAFAFLVRSAGLSLFLASAFYLGLMKGKRKEVTGVAAVLIAAAFLEAIWIGIKPGFFATFWSAPWGLIKRIFYLGPVVFKSVVWFLFGFCPDKMIVNIVSWIVYLALLGWFIFKARKAQVSYWGVFAFFYTTILILWSITYPMAPDGFVRYIFPLMPPLLFWIANSGKIFAKVILAGLIFLNIFNIARQFDFNDDIIYKKENQELFAWLKENLQEDEHYMFWEPRPLALMTGRTGTVHWRSPLEETQWFERIRTLNISYVITIKAVDNPFMVALESQPGFARVVWENQEFRIYETGRLSEL